MEDKAVEGSPVKTKTLLFAQKHAEAVAEQAEKDTEQLKEVGLLLRRWARSCVNLESQHAKLREKGRLRAKFDVEISDKAQQRFKDQVGAYKAVVKIVKKATEGGENSEKIPVPDGASATPVQMVVEFGKAAFEHFLRNYPDATLPPSLGQLEESIEKEVDKNGADSTSLKQVKEALEKKYGALVDEDKCKALAVDIVQKKLKEGATPAKKLKFAMKDAKLGNFLEEEMPGGYPTALAPRVKDNLDVKTAARALAPMGMEPSGAPTVRAPDEVAEGWIRQLSRYADMDETTMKETRIGILVKWYAKNGRPEDIAKASAKSTEPMNMLAEHLISRWRSHAKEWAAKKKQAQAPTTTTEMMPQENQVKAVTAPAVRAGTLGMPAHAATEDLDI